MRGKEINLDSNIGFSFTVTFLSTKSSFSVDLNRIFTMPIFWFTKTSFQVEWSIFDFYISWGRY